MAFAFSQCVVRANVLDGSGVWIDGRFIQPRGDVVVVQSFVYLYPLLLRGMVLCGNWAKFIACSLTTYLSANLSIFEEGFLPSEKDASGLCMRYESRSDRSVVDRLLHTQKVTGSKPVLSTTPFALL